MDFKSIPAANKFYIIYTLDPFTIFGLTGLRLACLFSSPREAMVFLENCTEDGCGMYGVIVNSMSWAHILNTMPKNYQGGILDYYPDDTEEQIEKKKFLFADILPKAA
ncbi:hypothetical protein KW791_03720 [Candidatus Parcubacteria bacterium]|nr:hypothetical protein [Candidatus Parcubacteria bacterium]